MARPSSHGQTQRRLTNLFGDIGWACGWELETGIVSRRYHIKSEGTPDVLRSGGLYRTCSRRSRRPASGSCGRTRDSTSCGRRASNATTVPTPPLPRGYPAHRLSHRALHVCIQRVALRKRVDGGHLPLHLPQQSEDDRSRCPGSRDRSGGSRSLSAPVQPSARISQATSAESSIVSVDASA